VTPGLESESRACDMQSFAVGLPLPYVATCVLGIHTCNVLHGSQRFCVWIRAGVVLVSLIQ